MGSKFLTMVGGGAGGGIKLESIAITTPPDNITYLPGEVFDPAGMVVTASYSNGATLTATGWTYSPSGALPEGTSEVEIIYTEAGVTKTAVQAITVERGTISVPTVSGSLTYNGQAQSPILTGYDADKMVLSGDTSGTNAGSYTAVVTPTAQYKWSDGSTEAKNIPWSIAKATPSITFDPTSVSLDTSTTSQAVSVTYTGDGTLSAQSDNSGVATASLDGTTLTVTGVETGNTAIQVSASEGTNYTSASASLSVAVQFAIIIPVVPTQSGSLTYKPYTLQTVSWNNYDPDQLTIGGSVKGTNAGTYTATFTPKPGYQWWDGTTETKNATWTIGKKTQAVHFSPSSNIVLDAQNKTATIKYSGDFHGPVSVSYSNTAKEYFDASVDTEQQIFIITAKKETGDQTFFLTFVFEGDKNYSEARYSIKVTVESLTSVFGVSWDSSNPSTALTRLTKANDPNKLVTVDITTEPVPAVGTGSGSSPFDSYMPWMGMEEYCASLVGSSPPKEVSALYKKGEDGFERTNPIKPVFVKIPEFYYKIEKIGNTFRYYVSDGPKSVFSLHPGSGCYLARYEGVKGNSSGTSTLRSNSGLTPSTSDTRDGFRVTSKATATGFQLRDIAALCAYNLLLLVEYADWDSQKKIGQGIVNDTAVHKTGETDAMVYHTGRAHSGDNAAVQYRGIENPWGNVREFVDGINFQNRTAYMCTEPDSYADDTTENYISSGITLPNSGFIKGFGFSSGFPWAFIPNDNGGSETTYIPDYMYSSSGQNVLNVGGYWTGASGAGLFSFNANFDSSVINNVTGARLQFREVKA
nr:MAG TPA: tail collar fiber protein [Caudoviricetes sp.]